MRESQKAYQSAYQSADPNLRKKAEASAERGITLVETLLSVGVMGAFVAGVLGLYAVTSSQMRVSDTQAQLISAISDVQERYAGAWIGATSITSAKIQSAIQERNTPYGEIVAGKVASDPGDAFRMGLEGIPSKDLSEICTPLRKKMIQLSQVDSAKCTYNDTQNTSALEFRVRSKRDNPKSTLTAALWATGTSPTPATPAPTPTPTPTPDPTPVNCGTDCIPTQWETPPTPEAFTAAKTGIDKLNTALEKMEASGAECDPDEPIAPCLRRTHNTYWNYGDNVFVLHENAAIGDDGTTQRRENTQKDFGNYFVQSVAEARTLYGHKKVYDVVRAGGGGYKIKICLRNCGDYDKITGREFPS